MKKTLIALCAIILLVSCQEWEPVYTFSYDDPAQVGAQTLSANATIAELVSNYEILKPWEIDKDIVISGKVSTTDRPGNFYKSFFIQDETGGIEIKIGRNALYNEYQQGQTIYIKCLGMTLGMYGNKSGGNYGKGMVQLGFSNPEFDNTEDTYQTTYFESPLFIDAHVIKGEQGDPVQSVVLAPADFPRSSDTQATNHFLGKLVTINNLSYGWFDPTYDELNEAFVLLYLDSTQNKKKSWNRIFVSGEDTGITTWAMSKTKMTEYLESGIWDDIKIGNANDQNYGTVGDLRGEGDYPSIEKAAGSVSQYFTAPNGTGVQIRTSGYSKFADAEIDPDVLAGRKTISATGILNLYQGKLQLVVNSLDDIKVE